MKKKNVESAQPVSVRFIVDKRRRITGAIPGRCRKSLISIKYSLDSKNNLRQTEFNDQSAHAIAIDQNIRHSDNNRITGGMTMAKKRAKKAKKTAKKAKKSAKRKK